MAREQMEKLTSDYQALQEQIQSLAIQKSQLSEQKEEFKEALAELEKATGKVYSTIGGVMIESTKEEAVKNVKDRQDSAEMRFGIITKQYDEAIKKEKTLRSEIETILKNETGRPQPGA